MKRNAREEKSAKIIRETKDLLLVDKMFRLAEEISKVHLSLYNYPRTNSQWIDDRILLNEVYLLASELKEYFRKV